MDHLAPLGPVYQAGTLSGNPLAMAAGIASLRMLRETPPYEHLEKIGSMLAQGIGEIARQKGMALQVPQVGSMFCLFFSDQPVRNFEQAIACEHPHFNSLFRSLLEAGIYLPPSSYETCFLSSCHGEDEAHRTLDAVRSAFSDL